jgi:hypothetical protein
MPRTLDEIRRKGLEVLRRELGRSGLIRFLQQFEAGKGDYTRERREWVDNVSLEELRRVSGRGTAERKKKPRAKK